MQNLVLSGDDQGSQQECKNEHCRKTMLKFWLIGLWKQRMTKYEMCKRASDISDLNPRSLRGRPTIPTFLTIIIILTIAPLRQVSLKLLYIVNGLTNDNIIMM